MKVLIPAHAGLDAMTMGIASIGSSNSCLEKNSGFGLVTGGGWQTPKRSSKTEFRLVPAVESGIRPAVTSSHRERPWTWGCVGSSGRSGRAM